MEGGDKKSGRVVILGGGIGGIQAALDLASSGYYVYIVEKSPSIGGVMSKLDKTFPTNDCSTCILSPKMVEAGRHLNIELLTAAEIIDVGGRVGNFKIKVKQKPRYVSLDDCKGCGDCAEACPVLLPHPFEENLATRKAIWRPFDQAVPSAFIIDKKGDPPCRARCPIHLNAHGYVMAVKGGNFDRAQEIVRKEKDFVFAATAARVCTHPCESVCNRGDLDKPVSIREIKRFVTDYEFEKFGGPSIDLSIEKERKEKIAIIGAGPAGLTAAFDLRKRGFKVTVFDALPDAGGMLLTGIPKYRLPKDILKKETDIVKGVVKCEFNHEVNAEEFKKLIDKYDAVFVATGAHKSRSMNVPGEELDGVMHGVGFLKKINLGEDVKLGKRVIVVGGGNSAIDAARTALRLGSDVTVVYRRSRKEMPAIPEEINAAIKEGIKFEFLRNPVEFIGDGKLKKVRLVKMKLGKPDSSGRRRPLPVEGSEYEIEVDNVLLAIGERPNLDFAEGVNKTKWGTLEVDEISLQTSIPKVFAGGDAVTGPNTFIDAVAAGKRAAISIERFIDGNDLKKDREWELPYESQMTGEKELAYRKERLEEKELSVKKRIKNFEEVISSPSAEDIVEEAKRCINCSGCSECFLCVDACQPNAILHDMVEKVVEIEAGALILSPGFGAFDPSSIENFGYGRYKNVVTSIQFERILSASGPYGGHITRPGDGKHPKKIAWIQCVGSRDKEHPFCSAVCCMYAVKEAVVAREHSKDVQPTIFFMDIRAYGKDFDRYIERARDEYGVRYVRARPSSVVEDSGTGDLIVTYEEDGKLKKEIFEMVILSTGLHPPVENKDIADKTGIELNEFGFAKTKTVSPVETTKEGIFVCGAFQGPKDIPETVAQASGAAGLVHSVLSDVRGKDVKEKEYPEEKFILNEKPRIGVFVCHCGINIGGYVDVKDVTEYAKTLPNVVYAADNLYTCSQDTQELIKEKIKEFNINRVVVASCTPRTHEPLFQETIREAGLNRYLFTMANIRDQDSWVHQFDKERATEKAKDLVAAAVSKARYLEPLSTNLISITKRALVVGGGISGMNAALLLANSGFETHIVEMSDRLGGNALNIHKTIDGMDVQGYLKDLTKKIEDNPLITIHLNSEIVNAEGFVGNFKTTISTNGTEEIIEHGVVIIATGAKEYVPKEYFYGKDERVLTQLELEKMVLNGEIERDKPKQIVMIQCVGSRNEEHPYCSRVCCSEAIKNAILLRENYPDAEVYVLYRDIRSYGFKELYYKKARELGVNFIRYTEDRKPEVTLNDGKLFVKTFDPIIRDELIFEPDFLVLSNGVVADGENNEKLSKFFKVPINQDKFFLEAHVKLRPVDFATEGVYLCGLAHSPKGIDESISQSYAAVSRALQVLTKEAIETSGTVSQVDELRCVGCGMCELVCPYQAVSVVEKKVLGVMKMVAEVNTALCKGCGLCSAACRSNAIDVQGFTNQEVLAELSSLGGINV